MSIVAPKLLPNVKRGVTTSVRNLTNMDSHLNELVKPSRLTEYVNKSPNLKKTLEHMDKFNKSEIGKFTSSPPKYIVENIGKGELAPLIPAAKSAAFGSGIVIGTGYGLNTLIKNKYDIPKAVYNKLHGKITSNILKYDNPQRIEEYYDIKKMNLPGHGGKKTKKTKTKTKNTKTKKTKTMTKKTKTMTKKTKTMTKKTKTMTKKTKTRILF
jgi:hypothetical protein